MRRVWIFRSLAALWVAVSLVWILALVFRGGDGTRAVFAETPFLFAERQQMVQDLVIERTLEKAESLAEGFFCEEALETLEEIPEPYREDERVAGARERFEEIRDGMVLYEKPVRHIFFHSLIVDTDLAFDGDYMANGYNYWMTTILEFERILEQMYEKGFILIDIHDIEHPLVPEGRIPFVLSIDDVNYYEYMKGDGFADRLVLDENGEVKNLYLEADGTEKIGNYDVMPILDEFVKEHPDFSLRGVKGVIAETGYEGTLGYRTNDLESPTLEADRESARKVAERLKETGWQFAVHGYGHRHTPKLSLGELQADTRQWKEEVGSLVGETDVYIYPYGEEVEYPSHHLAYLQEEGFRYYCGVWTKSFVQAGDGYIRQTRCNLDGYTLTTKDEVVADMIDTAYTRDPARPPLE